MTFEGLIKFIENDKYSWFQLRSSGGTRLHYSSDASREAIKISTPEIIDILKDKLGLMASGNYLLVLKRATEANDSSKIELPFTYTNPDNNRQPVQQLQGLNSTDFDKKVDKEVEKIKEQLLKEAKYEKQIEDLKKSIEEIKKDKKDKKGFDLNGLYGLGAMAAVLITEKNFPNSLETIKTMAAGIMGGSDDDDDDKKD